MATDAEWSFGYARQADADFKAWEEMQGNDNIAECHRLLFLQMACEKLCKAHLIQEGTPADTLQTSHGYVAKPLPIIIKQQIVFMKENLKGMQGVLQLAKHAANEIEVLNPAVDRDRQRPDNCEYPWENGQEVLHSPLDWSFDSSRLLTVRHGRTLRKLIREAINRLLVELDLRK